MREVAIDSLEIMGFPVTQYLAGAHDIRTMSDNERTQVFLWDAAGLTEVLAEVQRRIEWHDMPKYVPYKINGKLKYGQFEFQQENGERSIVIIR